MSFINLLLTFTLLAMMVLHINSTTGVDLPQIHVKESGNIFNQILSNYVWGDLNK